MYCPAATAGRNGLFLPRSMRDAACTSTPQSLEHYKRTYSSLCRTAPVLRVLAGTCCWGSSAVMKQMSTDSMCVPAVCLAGWLVPHISLAPLGLGSVSWPVLCLACRSPVCVLVGSYAVAGCSVRTQGRFCVWCIYAGHGVCGACHALSAATLQLHLVVATAAASVVALAQAGGGPLPGTHPCAGMQGTNCACVVCGWRAIPRAGVCIACSAAAESVEVEAHLYACNAHWPLAACGIY